MTSKSTFKRLAVQSAATHTVIFRTGGRDNFEWKRTLLAGSPLEMRDEAAKIGRGGRKALVVSIKNLAIGGLPETFE